MTKAMKEDNGEKRPRGRPPAGAIFVDGKWQLTELSMRLLVERALRTRERCREYSHNRWLAKQALLRSSHPELFAARRGSIDPRQTTLTPEVRSTERKADLIHSQKSDSSRNATLDIYAAAPIRRPQQRDDGTPSLSRDSASL